MDDKKEGKDTGLGEDHFKFSGLLYLMPDLERQVFYTADMLQLCYKQC